MNNINFTGINNIYIGKKTAQGYGSFLNHQNQLVQGEKINNTVKISCELTDDSLGNDFSFFQEQLSKCSDFVKQKFIDHDKPNKISMIVSRNEFNDDVCKISNSNFKFNDNDVYLNNRENLPLYTFMAKLSKKIANSVGINDNKKKYCDLFNNSVHEEAVKFIENM